MENYKLASRVKLRVSTPKGMLTVEQLWDLSLPDLDNLAVELEDQYKNSGRKSFLIKKSAKDQTLKLKFDIVEDILTTKLNEATEAAGALDVKKHNQVILALIEAKKSEELLNKPVAELEKMLK
jgi:hypothetical protein